MKKTLIITCITAFFNLIAISANARNIEADGTYMYVQRDTCELFMDVYHPKRGSQTTFAGKEKPTIIFMFGGGFIHGTRDDKSYMEWFSQMTENGYRVISIDYRLGLKGSKKVGVAQVNVLDAAIHMAVEDLFSATNFIIENADQLRVDPSNIVISGSSAGAISVMQAEYKLANRTSWAKVLPADFNYAGVMSFAGAILSRKGKVKYATDPCPTLMLHGTADKVVPYKQIKLFNLGFFGGKKLAERFKKFGYNYNMYHYDNNGHEVAGAMDRTVDLQTTFIENNILLGQRRIVDTLTSHPEIVPAGIKSLKELYGN